ncbi:deazaflavin-dependent nitroreductase family protein [Mycobacterium parascrofulaceum ATCC BAA-614]|uniref:Deazaflavin-dependent nitroreductase family protein n=1 Tax=Mycobacterium parascrofulaceum ATCC BAA-614 TaxID=525368 RepID=D5PI16_9MYCO|nr:MULTISPECIES: nitroreductase family deazaflavin-dependent oxidoreductase [Mycobacterium]EFG74272.1 deazaflavin-dependent nitroreductase family protein [Mycobacterium parascrofulaceum ATCC BAA-614]OCB41175.1 deazaflavin-dependent nitroreductase [Mycobacterium malmoense]
MTDTPDTQTINAFNKTIIDEFRTNGGKVGGQFANADLLLLSTTGAKSGQQRVSPLAYFRIDGKLIIIGSFAGSPVSPAWVHNLRANPQARVEIGAPRGVQEFAVTARELPSDERDALFGKVTAAAPGFAEYQSKTSRVIPLFELQPA